MALTTRPSQAGDGRTAPAIALTTARQPRRTPSSAANGISRACAPRKANHLARNRAGSAGLDHHPGADRHGMDRARHFHHQPAHPDHAAVDLDPVELGDLFSQRFHDAFQILIRPTQF